MKTIVVEDELNNLNLLTHFIKKYCPELELVATCRTKEEGVKAINKLHPELLFLDIILEDHIAFELLEEIDHSNVKIIFTTAFDEFALKAFRYHAVDYLLKPLQIDELIDAVNRIKNQDLEHALLQNRKALFKSFQTQANKYIIVSNIDKVNFVKSEDIMFCKSSGRYTEFYLVNEKKLLASKALGEYEFLLNPNFFFRIHKSYIVNLDKISSISKKSGNYCHLKDGQKIPISRRRMDNLIKFINAM